MSPPFCQDSQVLFDIGDVDNSGSSKKYARDCAKFCGCVVDIIEWAKLGFPGDVSIEAAGSPWQGFSVSYGDTRGIPRLRAGNSVTELVVTAMFSDPWKAAGQP